ncbi:hypothetical protein NXW89_00050 [Bacteroides thetaiotaomicron]|nr:hypothetical protein [Bacteroides thetaiotaomicron]
MLMYAEALNELFDYIL